MAFNNAKIVQSSPVQSSPVNSCTPSFLITGANFGNKGAQSMLFVTTDELRRRFPSSTVYFATSEKYQEELYSFKKIYTSPRAVGIAMGGFAGFKAMTGQALRDTIKLLIGRRDVGFGHYHDLASIMPEINAIIDISGFSLSSKWGNHGEYYLKKIQLAEKYGVPVYLMPQSFGPFDYPSEVINEIKPLFNRVLSYPRIIFAREKEGFDCMTDLFGLSQVRLSTDLVLQNKGVDLANIFTVPPSITVPKIESSRELAGIVPNMRCFDHGNKENILSLYREIINYILGKGCTVVLFRHSREDIEACRILKEFYPDNENVVLVENEFSCLEYNEFVRQFKFLVCSRYHGLVHAGKNNIPCLYLGWAVKYRRLAEVLGQSRYVFDITSDRIDVEKIVSALSSLMENYSDERRVIAERLAEIQKHNCFDIVEEDMRASGIVS